MARKVIGRAFFEIEHAQQADDQQQAGRATENSIDDGQRTSARKRQLLADQHKLDRERGDDSERRDMMEKREQSRHGAWPPRARRRMECRAKAKSTAPRGDSAVPY